MSPQHDFIIDNSTGANVRADINSVLQAIASNNSGSSAPSTTYALQTFANTTDSMLQLRNAANNAFVNLRKFDGALPLPDGSASSPSLFFDDDTNTGLFSSAADTLNFTTGGVERMELGTATVFNEDGADVDFRIEGDTNANLFYVDAGNDRIGIATSSPSAPMHIVGSGNTTILKVESTDDDANVAPIIELFRNSASPADNDQLGRIDFRADDASGGDSTFARIAVTAIDVTNNTEDARIDFTAVTNDTFTPTMSITGQKVGIGTTSPASPLHLHESSSGSIEGLKVTNSTTGTAVGDGLSIGLDSSENVFLFNYESTAMKFGTSGSERMRLDSSGRLLIGVTSTDDYDGFNSSLQVSGTGGDDSSITISRFSNDISNGNLILAKSRNGSVGGNTVLQANDICGAIQFHGNDGGGFHQAASISSKIESGIGSDDVPANLIFSTNGGSTSVTERIRIDSLGNLLVGRTSTVTINGNTSNSTFEQHINGSWSVAVHSSQTAKRGYAAFYAETGDGSSGGDHFAYFANQTNSKFMIFGNGNVENRNNSYGQISDETLKQDIVDAASQWDDIKNLRVRKFRFKDSPTGVLQIGVVAQEIEKVSAGLVDTDNEGIKSVKYSILYMKAVKALQEAITKIEVLETKVAALEAA